jgi:hypothetical protein
LHGAFDRAARCAGLERHRSVERKDLEAIAVGLACGWIRATVTDAIEVVLPLHRAICQIASVRAVLWQFGACGRDVEQLTRTLAAYRRLLAGELRANEALRAAAVHERYGVTTALRVHAR